MKTNRSRKAAFLFSTALLATAAILPVGVARAQGVAERAGQALDDVGRGIRNGVHNAVARGSTAATSQELVGRVHGRLHWDKALIGSTVELEVQGTGVAILRGAVPDAAARQRAIALTRDTIGVTQVVDELAVLPAGRVIPAGPPAAIESTTTTSVIKP